MIQCVRRKLTFPISTVVVTLLLSSLWATEPTPKRIYIAPDDHTDYMWTMDEEGYRRAFLEMIDYYLDQIDATKENPPQHQARWNCDCNFWLWTYERNRSASDFNRLVSRIRDGHISAPLNAVASCYGGQPTEAVLRGMYYAGSLERRHNLRFLLAVAMENQTLPYGLGSLWAGAGAKYSWKGICGCASKMRSEGAETRQHEIYWWQGADESRILMKWNSLRGPEHNRGMGGYAEAFNPGQVVEHVDTDPDFQKRYPFDVIGAFGKGWDLPKTLTDEFVKIAKEKTNADRQVIVSNEADFFADFETTYAAMLPSVSAAYGNEWELYSASMPETSARVRRAVEKLRTAEAMAALVTMQQTDFMRRHVTARDKAWMNLGLYWEHNWTADSPVIPRTERAIWLQRHASEIESYVETLQTDATRTLGALIRGKGDYPRFFAFNALSWSRSDFVDVRLSSLESIRMPTHFSILGEKQPPQSTSLLPLHVVDIANETEVPSQIVTLNGERFVRVLAHEVPSVGYKVYEVRPGIGAGYASAAIADSDTLENDAYLIKIAGRGAITSLIDKQHGNRELVREINELALNDLGPSEGSLTLENVGPVSITMLATSESPLRHTTRITLFRDNRRIEFHNEITQNFTDIPSWGFGFNLEKPNVWHEEIGAVILARLLADGGHYSARNARYDWLTLNHFADISGEDGFGATLSNADCAFFRLGQSSVNNLDIVTPLLSVLVGGQVDGENLGIPNQGGENRFTQRFALQTHGTLDTTAAMRFSMEHQNPLQAGIVIGGRSYPEKEFSLLSIAESDVVAWAVKPAEEFSDGSVVLRLWNQRRDPMQTSVRFSVPFSAIKETSHIETELRDAATDHETLKLDMKPQQLCTFRVLMIKK